MSRRDNLQHIGLHVAMAVPCFDTCLCGDRATSKVFLATCSQLPHPFATSQISLPALKTRLQLPATLQPSWVLRNCGALYIVGLYRNSRPSGRGLLRVRLRIHVVYTGKSARHYSVGQYWRCHHVAIPKICLLVDIVANLITQYIKRAYILCL